MYMKVSKFSVTIRSYTVCEFELNRITFYAISFHRNIVGKRIVPPLTPLRIGRSKEINREGINAVRVALIPIQISLTFPHNADKLC